VTYLSECLADSPVALWLLGESSGTNANDESATNNDGTYAGSTYTQGQTGAIAGVTATAFSGGTTARVTAPDNAAYDLGTTFSVEAWVKRTRTGVEEHVVVRNGDQCWRLKFTPADYVSMVQQGTANGFRSTATITDTNWHHIIVTNAGATHVIWVDGVDAGLFVDAATSFSDASGGAIEIANSEGGTWNPLVGTVQGVGIYPTALASGRVAAHYAAAPATGPTWVSPADTASMGSTPVLVLDSEVAAVPQHFWMELDTVNTFDSGNLRTLRTDISQTGWEYWNGSAWTAFPATGLPAGSSGNEVRHTVQSALSTATWYRRVRAGI
jgi:hypothetical protein